MAKKERKKLTDDEMKALVDAEIHQAMGSFGGGTELSKERIYAMDRYLGEPLDDEITGRSQVHARDVLTTIEWIMPSLMAIFTGQNAVELRPVGPEDVKAAEQETNYLHHMFFAKQNGWLVLYTWFKDALLQKNGVTKVWVDERKVEKRETYRNITTGALGLLVGDKDTKIVERTPKVKLSGEGDLQQQQDVTVIHKETDLRIVVENVPPEEHMISKDARSVDPKLARANIHHTTPTASDLIEAGFKQSEVDMMDNAPGMAQLSAEKSARNNLDDESNIAQSALINEAMQEKDVKEVYIRADRNGDGIAELLKVTRSGDFIDIEEIDLNPFNALTPVILPHKFYGLSVADLVNDLQVIRTGLLRAYMDNIYQSINGLTYYDENAVNIDDMLVSTPYGLRGTRGNPNQSVLHIQPQGLPAQAFTLLEVVDKMRTERLGDFQTQLDPQVLKDANTGVVSELLNEARAKVEMIARIFAETGVVSLFRDMHQLARMHSNREDVVKMNNEWIPVNPAEWRERTDFKVKVGLGTRNKHERQGMFRELMGMQAQVIEAGGFGTLTTEQHIYHTQRDFLKTFGEVNPDEYIQDPAKVPPKPPEPEAPDPSIQVAQMAAQIEQMKLQQNGAIKQAELQLREREGAGKQELERMKQELAAIKAQASNATAQSKVALDAQVFNMEDELAKAKFLVESQQDWRQQVIDQYKAELQAVTQLAVADASATEAFQAKVQSSQEKLTQTLSGMVQQIEKIEGQIGAPRSIFRDDQGNITGVGDKKITRDADGNLTGIE